MYASELMEKIRKEPEKYEGKKYKGYPIMHPGGKLYDELTVHDGVFVVEEDSNWAFVSSHTELEEIPQPVTWQEALEANADGRKIQLDIKRIDGVTIHHVFDKTLKSQCGWIATAEGIIKGKWYIID